MREAQKLLEALERDGYARLKWAVLKEEGLCPFSLPALLMGKWAVLRIACHMILDKGGASEERGGSFSMERFMKMKEAANG